MHTLRLASLVGAALAATAPHVTLAQDMPAGPEAGIMPLAVDLASAAIEPTPLQFKVTAPSPFDASAIDDTALHRIAGREDINQLSYSEQVAGVTKNSIGDNSVTGNAQIAGNAFQNLSGLAILNVNTGNNVAINASMNVNVSFVAQP